MKKLKVALIGAGQIARVSHIPNYKEMKEVTVAGICDTRLDSAKALAEQFAIPAWYDDHRRMLEEVKPDIVSVCVPNKFHCELTVDALRAGCHVLCEKPPALSGQEAELMERTAGEQGKLLSYGFHLRHGQAVSLLKNKIDRGELGRIYAVNASWMRRRGIPGWGCFTNREIQGGGPLIDLGAHVLDLALYLLDYPEVDYVCADMFDLIGRQGGTGFMGKWDAATFSVEDALFGYIRFRNGTVLRLDTTFAINMRDKDVRKVSIFGDKQGADLFPLEIYSGEDGEIWNQQYPFEESEDLHKKELMQFVNACLGKEELLVTGKQGSYVQRLIEKLYESARQRRPVQEGS